MKRILNLVLLILCTGVFAQDAALKARVEALQAKAAAYMFSKQMENGAWGVSMPSGGFRGGRGGGAPGAGDANAPARPHFGDGKGFGGRPGGWRPGMAMANPAITSLAIIGLMDTNAGKTTEGKAKLNKALDYVVSCKQPDGTIMEPRDRRTYPVYSTSICLLHFIASGEAVGRQGKHAVGAGQPRGFEGSRGGGRGAWRDSQGGAQNHVIGA